MDNVQTKEKNICLWIELPTLTNHSINFPVTFRNSIAPAECVLNHLNSETVHKLSALYEWY